MKINWDDANSRTIKAGFFRVSATREEVSLVFAADEPLRPDVQEGIIILFSERIVLSPFTAKRLSIALNQLLAGDRQQPPLPAPTVSLPGASDAPSPMIDKMKSQKSADWLFQLIGSLDVPTYFERSFKIIPGKILANRFLCGIGRKDLQEAFAERIVSLCEGLGMAAHLRASLRDQLGEANSVHFGFEEGEGACLYKVYLEFLEQVRERIGDNREMRTPLLLFLAFKWDACQNTKNATTSYMLHPWLSVPDMLSRAADSLRPAVDGTTLSAVENIIRLAAERIPPHDLTYLDVTEKGNPRRSFDLNVYRAQLQMGEIYPLLAEIARRFSISYGEFHDLYEPIKNQRFGHLAGGIGRDGKAFITLYHGAENVRFHQTEAPAMQERLRTVPATARPAHLSRNNQTEREGSHFLFDLVKGLQVPFGVERSFKLLSRTILGDRLLLGFQRKALSDQEERLLDICRRLQMPSDFLEVFQSSLPQANMLLFGYEGNPTNPLFKAYLEFGHKLKEIVPGDPDSLKPFLIHMGFKWGTRDQTKKMRTYYTCFPLLSVDDMLKRVSTGIYGSAINHPGKIVEDILITAANRMDPRSLLYCEAKEGENPRSSFDINLYWANLRLLEVYPLLMAMACHYSVPLDAFRSIYHQIKGLIFGHLTGGVDREGRDFLTVYFSEKGSTR